MPESISATVTPWPPNGFGDRPSVPSSVFTCGGDSSAERRRPAACSGLGRWALTIASAEQPSKTEAVAVGIELAGREFNREAADARQLGVDLLALLRQELARPRFVTGLGFDDDALRLAGAARLAQRAIELVLGRRRVRDADKATIAVNANENSSWGEPEHSLPLEQGVGQTRQ